VLLLVEKLTTPLQIKTIVLKAGRAMLDGASGDSTKSRPLGRN